MVVPCQRYFKGWGVNISVSKTQLHRMYVPLQNIQRYCNSMYEVRDSGGHWASRQAKKRCWCCRRRQRARRRASHQAAYAGDYFSIELASQPKRPKAVSGVHGLYRNLIPGLEIDSDDAGLGTAYRARSRRRQ